MKLTLHNIFLIDGLGAFLSAAFSGLFLPTFSNELGLPTKLLYSFAFLTFAFGIYSFIVHSIIIKKTIRLLLCILLANCIYCVVSVSAMLLLNGITSIGKILLMAELIVLVFIIGLERIVYQKS